MRMRLSFAPFADATAIPSPAEIEKLIKAARDGRYGHRDATLILIAFRHGLRASEICDLEWSQVEFGRSASLHVRRVKNGKPSVHPLRGDEVRALRCGSLPASPDSRCRATAQAPGNSNNVPRRSGYRRKTASKNEPVPPQAAAEQARLLIEQAEALGEPPEDPLVLFSVLYGVWAANLVAFNGELSDLAAQFLRLAEKRGATVPLMVGHAVTGMSLMFTGNVAEGRAYLDRAIALYDPAEHRPLTTRFGQDHGVEALCIRSWTLWFLGYPEAALADAKDALKNAREIGQAGSLMQALVITASPFILRRDYVAAEAQLAEVVALADEKGAALWKRTE
jgi:hypothetical protein